LSRKIEFSLSYDKKFVESATSSGKVVRACPEDIYEKLMYFYTFYNDLSASPQIPTRYFLTALCATAELFFICDVLLYHGLSRGEFILHEGAMNPQ